MTDTKLGKAFKQYSDINIAMVKWMLGIVLVQVAYIITRSYDKNILFFLFLGGAIISFIIAWLIMCVLSKEADIELYSALKAAKNSEMSQEEFAYHYHQRLSKLNAFLTDFVIDYNLTGWLFLIFFVDTVLSIVLILMGN
ncbi:MAG: hypothetical protein Kow0098_03410 [Ignavibacteriaceae bacterium]